MTDSKTPWLARGGAIALMMAAGIALAACSGGGGGLNEDEEATLQERVVTAEAEAAAAEAAKKKAEDDKKKAEDDKEAAERLLQAAVARRQQEEQRRQEAEADREAAEEERDAAREVLDREQAEDALAQLNQALATFNGDVTVNYRAVASVTGAGAFRDPSGSSDGSWYVSRFEGGDRVLKRSMVVYSDVGPPTRELLSEVYESEFNADANDDRYLLATLDVDEAGDAQASLITSSSFPRRGGSTSDPFIPTVDSDPEINANPGVGPGLDQNPRNDYDTVRLAGAFDGASGHFLCVGTDCTATHHGGNVYTLAAGSGWQFRVGVNAHVSVADDSYTYFGWWRKTNLEAGGAADSFSFSTFTGGMGSMPPDLFASLNGTYTYNGRAAGQYALYSPALQSSGEGEFTADAMLRASFDSVGDDTISGRITGISGQPDWELTLNETTISGNGGFTNGTNGVDWSIRGFSETGGNWSGQFYFDEDVGAVPTAAVGTFIGHYNADGRIIGSFGAHED